jgi:tetratricopeptide (TPR) repeat protein
VEVAQKYFTAAKADATAVTDLTSTDPLSWYNLGSVYYAAGEYDSAIAPLTQAISLQNNYADALFMLGLTYGKLDRMAEGLPYLQQVASLNPANTIVTSALKSFQHALDIATSTPMTP